jgi:hypothetical protein
LQFENSQCHSNLMSILSLNIDKSEE